MPCHFLEILVFLDDYFYAALDRLDRGKGKGKGKHHHHHHVRLFKTMTKRIVTLD